VSLRGLRSAAKHSGSDAAEEAQLGPGA
jgi:hypothetical protein